MKEFLFIIIILILGVCLAYFGSTQRVYYLNSDNTITSVRIDHSFVETYDFKSPSLNDTIIKVFDADFNVIYIAPINEVPRKISFQPNNMLDIVSGLCFILLILILLNHYDEFDI